MKLLNKIKTWNFFDILAHTGSNSVAILTTFCSIIVLTNLPRIGLIYSTVFFYILVPPIAYLILRKKGLISDPKLDFSIQKQEERTFFNIILLLAFLTNFVLIKLCNVPIYTDISFLVLVSFLIYSYITLFWKISMHLTQTVISITSLAFLFPDYSKYILLIGYLIYIPLVCWSRVYHKHHTWLQVLCAVVLNSLLAYIVFTIL